MHDATYIDSSSEYLGQLIVTRAVFGRADVHVSILSICFAVHVKYIRGTGE